MAPGAGLSAALINAYRRTHYHVADQRQSFTMMIDQPCGALQECLRRFQVAEAAYVSAWNPRSEPTDTATNDRAQRALLAEIAMHGWVALQGEGIDPAGQWPPEPSVLVLGIPRARACELGRSYGQNAIVIVNTDDGAVPRLMLLA